jgi:prophage DNA circulation protein
MKRHQIILSVFTATAFAVTVGCKKDTSVAATESAADPSVQLDRVKKKTEEALDATKDYAYAQKAEYAAKIRAEVTELNKELDQLSAKIDGASASAKVEAKAKLQDVRDRVTRLSGKVDGLQNATESTWDEVKSGVRKGYDEVKESFTQFRSWLSEKIAP